MAEVVLVTLESCTVFWQDLGLTDQQIAGFRSNAVSADRVWSTMENWLTQNVKGAWRGYNKGVWFANGKEAALFKLFMSGEPWA